MLESDDDGPADGRRTWFLRNVDMFEDCDPNDAAEEIPPCALSSKLRADPNTSPLALAPCADKSSPEAPRDDSPKPAPAPVAANPAGS